MNVFKRGYTSNMSCPNCGGMFNNSASRCLENDCSSYKDLCSLITKCINCKNESPCYLWIDSDDTEIQIMALFGEMPTKQIVNSNVDQRLKDQLNANLRSLFGCD
jgi:hypothetical protein